MNAVTLTNKETEEENSAAYIYYDGKRLNDKDGNAYEISTGDKQFAVVGNKMVIFPDKVFFELGEDDATVKPFYEAIYYPGVKFFANGDIVYYGSNTNYWFTSDGFKAGDLIQISGCSDESNNKVVKVKGVSRSSLTVTNEDGSETNVFSPTPSGKNYEYIYINETIPALDYICESENRLVGCSNSDNTIYVSAQGDPTVFDPDGTDAGAFAVAVGTDGKFTGCTSLGSSVLFWKEDKLHKLLGSFPSEYTVYDYTIDGVQDGSHKSQVVINETLYYKGVRGVYAYGGGVPSLISAGFGNRMFENGVAGTDGKNYYLSVDDGDASHLYVYDTESKIWMREDDTRVREFARVGNGLYFLSGDTIYIADSGEEDADVEWEAQFTPFYETLQGRKTYSKILLRMELPEGSWVKAWTRIDGRGWTFNGNRVGKDYDTTVMLIPINRCDKFEVKLTGKGQCTILAMLREFSVGSEM